MINEQQACREQARQDVGHFGRVKVEHSKAKRNMQGGIKCSTQELLTIQPAALLFPFIGAAGKLELKRINTAEFPFQGGIGMMRDS